MVTQNGHQQFLPSPDTHPHSSSQKWSQCPLYLNLNWLVTYFNQCSCGYLGLALKRHGMFPFHFLDTQLPCKECPSCPAREKSHRERLLRVRPHMGYEVTWRRTEMSIWQSIPRPQTSGSGLLGPCRSAQQLSESKTTDWPLQIPCETEEPSNQPTAPREKTTNHCCLNHGVLGVVCYTIKGTKMKSPIRVPLLCW